jgi:hypothetical protein
MLEREEKIEMIVHHEVDRMNIDALRFFAEDHMTQDLEKIDDENIDDLFLTVMNGQKI